MGIRPPADCGDYLVRGRVSGEVKVRRLTPQEEVAHRSAHQREVVTGTGKHLTKLDDDVRYFGTCREALGEGNHHAEQFYTCPS